MSKYQLLNEDKEVVDRVDCEDISDGYHTMNELYDHRMALNIILFKMMFKLDHQYRKEDAWNKPLIMKSVLHNDGSMFKGYFIVFAVTNVGQISYHYKMEHWNKFEIPIVPNITYPYDGHTSQDIIDRLMKL